MEEKEKIEQLEESDKKDKKRSTFKVVLISLLLVGLLVVCGWFAGSYFTRNNTTTKPKEEKEIEKQNEAQKATEKQGEWKSLGTDVSKIQDVYDTVKDYIYVQSRPNGGLSLYKKKLMDVLASKLQQSDLTNVIS